MAPLLRGAGIYGTFIHADELPFFCRQQLNRTSLALWEEKILRFILSFLDSSVPVVQESSGTTGIPKGITLSRDSMIKSALLTVNKFKLGKKRTALLCLPVDYIAGKMMIIRALVAGMDLVWTEPSACPSFSGDRSIDLCAMVPMQLRNLIEQKRSLACIKNLLVGGAELPHDLEDLLQTISTRIFETFGMAETFSHIAIRRVNGPRPTPWFQTMPGINISTDPRGCLVIEGSHLQGTVTTNDLVELIGKGRFLWRGRIDNLINSGGIKINPEPLEKLIAEILGHESYLVGLPDKKLGQRLTMVTTHLCSSDEKTAMLETLRHRLPPLHYPAEIIVIPSFPRNRSLKIDRKELYEEALKRSVKT
jgi:O-succinylbenzoic acid--CoA ligase